MLFSVIFWDFAQTGQFWPASQVSKSGQSSPTTAWTATVKSFRFPRSPGSFCTGLFNHHPRSPEAGLPIMLLLKDHGGEEGVWFCLWCPLLLAPFSFGWPSLLPLPLSLMQVVGCCPPPGPVVGGGLLCTSSGPSLPFPTFQVPDGRLLVALLWLLLVFPGKKV